MDSTQRKLEYVELDAMDAPDNNNDFTRGVALGIILAILAAT